MGWTEVIIDTEALRNNLRRIKEIYSSKLYAVVKSNAYGHGLIRCAKIFLEEGAHALAVFLPQEAEELRNAGIDCEVLLLGGFLPDQASYAFEKNTTVAVGDWWMLEVLEKEGEALRRSARIHLKLDTGMGRLGFTPEQWEELKKRLKALKWVKCEGIMSHLSVADEKSEDSKSFTKEQLKMFREAISLFQSSGAEIFHIANSAGVLFHPESHFNAARVGIALYGGIEDPKLKQAMTVRTKLLSVKEVPPGWSISYGRTYTTTQRTTLGVIPCGYATGYLRTLSNKAYVEVRGTKRRVLGRVCMDMTVIDITSTTAKAGDWVYLLGGEGEGISVFECAQWFNTITYEVFCLFSLGASSMVYR